MLKIESEMAATEFGAEKEIFLAPKLAMSEPPSTTSTTSAVAMPTGRWLTLSRSSETPSGARVSMMPNSSSTTMAPM